MANFVLIEKDPKVVREITGFVRELAEDHRVILFPTIEAFEALYFADPLEKILKHADNLPWLHHWPRIGVERIISSGLNTTKSLFEEPVRLAFHKEHWVLHRIEGAKETFLGKDINSLTNKPLEQVLHISNVFSEVIEQFKTELKKSGKAEITIAIETEQGKPINIVTGLATTNTLECEITFTDVTKTVSNKINPNLEEPQEGESKNSDDLVPVSTIHVLIFQGKQIKKDLKNWITDTFAKLKAGNYFPEGGTSRFIALKWEDDGRTTEDYSHPVVEDVIYLPIDRLIFLQKLEIISKLPKMGSPSFLFNFKTSLEAEISKRSYIHEINDVGFRMVNPGAIRKGIFAHFFVQLNPNKPMVSVYAKARQSVPHPDEQSKFVVQFDYFGLSNRDLTEIRRLISSNTSFKAFKESDEKRFKFNPDNLFFSPEEKRQKTILYFDIKSKDSDSVIETLKSDLDNVRIVREISLSRFIQTYYPDEYAAGIKDLKVLTKEDMNNFFPTMTVNIEENKFVSLDGEGEEFTLFGYTTEEFKTDPELWLKLMHNQSSVDELRELLITASRGTIIDTDITVKFKDATLGKIGVEIRVVSNPVVSLLFKPTKVTTTEDLSLKSVNSVDFILANHSLVPTGVDSWVRGLNDFFAKKGLSNGNLPVIIIGDEKDQTRFRDFCLSTVSGLVLQPINKKALSNYVSYNTSNPFTINRDANLNWSTHRLVSYVARETSIESMAEFGASFVNTHPMAVGTNIYLHCEIFSKATDRPVLARVYGSEPHPQVKDQFLCHVLFFGIQDQFLKFTRSWIRESYAQSKQAEGS